MKVEPASLTFFSTGNAPYMECMCVHDGDSIEDAPYGTLRHRHYHCRRTAPLRDMAAPPKLVQQADEAKRLDIRSEHFALDRGILQPVDGLVPKPEKEATFHWEV